MPFPEVLLGWGFDGGRGKCLTTDEFPWRLEEGGGPLPAAAAAAASPSSKPLAAGMPPGTAGFGSVGGLGVDGGLGVFAAEPGFGIDGGLGVDGGGGFIVDEGVFDVEVGFRVDGGLGVDDVLGTEGGFGVEGGRGLVEWGVPVEGGLGAEGGFGVDGGRGLEAVGVVGGGGRTFADAGAGVDGGRGFADVGGFGVDGGRGLDVDGRRGADGGGGLIEEDDFCAGYGVEGGRGLDPDDGGFGYGVEGGRGLDPEDGGLGYGVDGGRGLDEEEDFGYGVDGGLGFEVLGGLGSEPGLLEDGFGVDGGRGFPDDEDLPPWSAGCFECGGRGGGGRGLDALPSGDLSSARGRLPRCGAEPVPFARCAWAGAGPLGGFGFGFPFDDEDPYPLCPPLTYPPFPDPLPPPRSSLREKPAFFIASVTAGAGLLLCPNTSTSSGESVNSGISAITLRRNSESGETGSLALRLAGGDGGRTLTPAFWKSSYVRSGGARGLLLLICPATIRASTTRFFVSFLPVFPASSSRVSTN